MPLKYEGFSFPEGRTYSPPDYIGQWYPLWGRALCEALAAPMGALCTMLHFCEAVIIVHAVGRRTANAMLEDDVSDAAHLPANCLQKPATGSFVAEMGIVPIPICFFNKSNKYKKRKDGDTRWQSTIWKQKSSAVELDALL